MNQYRRNLSVNELLLTVLFLMVAVQFFDASCASGQCLSCKFQIEADPTLITDCKIGVNCLTGTTACSDGPLAFYTNVTTSENWSFDFRGYGCEGYGDKEITMTYYNTNIIVYNVSSTLSCPGAGTQSTNYSGDCTGSFTQFAPVETNMGYEIDQDPTAGTWTDGSGNPVPDPWDQSSPDSYEPGWWIYGFGPGGIQHYDWAPSGSATCTSTNMTESYDVGDICYSTNHSGTYSVILSGPYDTATLEARVTNGAWTSLSSTFTNGTPASTNIISGDESEAQAWRSKWCILISGTEPGKRYNITWTKVSLSGSASNQTVMPPILITAPSRGPWCYPSAAGTNMEEPSGWPSGCPSNSSGATNVVYYESPNIVLAN